MAALESSPTSREMSKNQINQLTVTYKNSQAANTSNGWTFLDRDSDGWYDYIERTNGNGTEICCGFGDWQRLNNSQIELAISGMEQWP